MLGEFQQLYGLRRSWTGLDTPCAAHAALRVDLRAAQSEAKRAFRAFGTESGTGSTFGPLKREALIREQAHRSQANRLLLRHHERLGFAGGCTREARAHQASTLGGLHHRCARTSPHVLGQNEDRALGARGTAITAFGARPQKLGLAERTGRSSPWYRR